MIYSKTFEDKVLSITPFSNDLAAVVGIATVKFLLIDTGEIVHSIAIEGGNYIRDIHSSDGNYYFLTKDSMERNCIMSARK